MLLLLVQVVQCYRYLLWDPVHLEGPYHLAGLVHPVDPAFRRALADLLLLGHPEVLEVQARLVHPVQKYAPLVYINIICFSMSP